MLMDLTLWSYSFSVSLPSRTPSVTSSIQQVSKNLNFPFSGISIKYLYRKGLRLSSSVGGLSMVATWKNLGSMFFMISPRALPLPADPQPSKMTMTGSFASLIFIWQAASFSFSSFRYSFISSFSGFLGFSKSASMAAPSF